MNKKRKFEEQIATNNQIETETYKIIKSIKEKPKTFLELINILKIFNDNKENEKIKIKSINYFNKYHKNKYFHYFDKKGYIDFILNIFFDNSFNVFKKITNTIKFSYFKYKLYKKLLIDKRFNKWFIDLYENDNDQLKNRLAIMEEEFELSPYQYDINRLHDIVYKNIKDRILDGFESFGYYSDGSTYSNRENRNSNNNNNHFTINKEQMKSFILPDIVIEKIIRDSLWYIDDRMDKVIINDNLLSFALVSKQFFKVLSKILNNEYFEWKKSMIQFDNDSQFSLIKQPPLYFDYNSIRLIPYSSSRQFVELLFSRIESFYLKTDEYDIILSDSTLRKFKFCCCPNNKVFNEDKTYRHDINSSGYLIYPPPMPSLQSITIDEYYGVYSSNYQDLFTNILIENFKNIKINDNSCADDGGGGGSSGVKRFSIGFYIDWNRDMKNETDFLKPFLEHHLNSLEKVVIDCYHNRLKIFNRLKSSINNQSKNNIEWILPEDPYGTTDTDSDSSKYGDDATDDESF
ncbi:hypothetical protein ACTFIT_008700 [Dictyostelium discoideum]